MSGSTGAAKASQPPRSCDACRKRKAKCDAASRPADQPCSNCQLHKIECHFSVAKVSKTIPKKYIEALERRMELLEKLAFRVVPADIDIICEVGESFTVDSWIEDNAGKRTRGPYNTSKGKSSSASPGAPSPKASSSKRRSTGPSEEIFAVPQAPVPAFPVMVPSDTLIKMEEISEDEEERKIMGNRTMDRWCFGTDQVGKQESSPMEPHPLGHAPHPLQHKFHGTSSTMQSMRSLVKDIISQTDRQMPLLKRRRDYFWRLLPWEHRFMAPFFSVDPYKAHFQVEGCPTLQYGHLPPLEFPPEDLGKTLLDTYFKYYSWILPVINEKSFRKMIEMNVHLTWRKLGCIYLMICAIASKWSNDPRVCAPESQTGGKIDWQTSGLKYYVEVSKSMGTAFHPPTLESAQLVCLLAFWAWQSPFIISVAWVKGGVGLRNTLDIGAHRKMTYKLMQPYERQMWKRCFWSLMALDKIGSAVLGRTPALLDEDIDAELPLDVSDEYYDADTKEWKQPKDIPSTMGFLRETVKLCQTLGSCLRTLYTTSSARARMGAIGHTWEQYAASELDSSLNRWQAELPEHLIWSESMNDDVFLHQATMLQLLYHYVQIIVHRPFALRRSGSHPLAASSLAMCTTAARATAELLVFIVRRNIVVAAPMSFPAAVNSAVIMVMQWLIMRKENPKAELPLYGRCVRDILDYFAVNAIRWQGAGMLGNMLLQLIKEVEMDLPASRVEVPTRDPRHWSSSSSWDKLAAFADMAAGHRSVGQPLNTAAKQPAPPTTQTGNVFQAPAYGPANPLDGTNPKRLGNLLDEFPATLSSMDQFNSMPASDYPTSGLWQAISSDPANYGNDFYTTSSTGDGKSVMHDLSGFRSLDAVTMSIMGLHNEGNTPESTTSTSTSSGGNGQAMSGTIPIMEDLFPGLGTYNPAMANAFDTP